MSTPLVTVSPPELQEVIRLVANISHAERKIITDLPDHFRRIIVHAQKVALLISQLKDSVKEGQWVKKKEIFSLVAKLLPELDVRKGLISTEVYIDSGLAPLFQQQGTALQEEQQISFTMYDALQRHQDHTPAWQQKTERLREKLALALQREKIAISAERHLEELLEQFRSLLSLHKERITAEQRILKELQSLETVFWLERKIIDLQRLIDILEAGSNYSVELLRRMKEDFYLPFLKYLNQKIEMENNVAALLQSKEKLFSKNSKLTKQDIWTEYLTMSSPSEALQFFFTLEKIKPFLEESAWNFIQKMKGRVNRESRFQEYGLRRSLFEKDIDPLTGAGMRRMLEKQFTKLLLGYQRSKNPFSVILLDIDFFKQFNDTYGHLVGDEVLKGVASSVRNRIRSADLLIRYGGEEFAVLLPNTNKPNALAVAEEIRKIIPLENSRFVSPVTQKPVSISIGVATFPQDAGKDNSLTGLLKKADQALYRAKRGGRNRVVAA